MLTSFHDLLEMAKIQDEPQRLLLVLARTEAKGSNGKTHHSGTISPIVCTDKLPDEIESFAALVSEADEVSKDWNMVLVASLGGADGEPPTSEAAAPYLEKMVKDVMTGQDLSRYLILDRDEQIVTMELRDGFLRI